MTESFYIRVDITSKEKLEFYEDRDDGEYVELPDDPKKNKRFNKLAEKAIKKVLMANVDVIEEALEDTEGFEYEKQEALETVASKFYDPESDGVAIAENMSPIIKFKVARKKRRI